MHIGSIENIDTGGDVCVGSFRGRHLNAKIKGIQLYERALKQEEIIQVMQWDNPL